MKVRNKTSAAEYLAFLSMKYQVDADKFFNALVLAQKNRKSTCGSLSIEFRCRQKDKVVLLITRGSKVVAQFPITEELLLRQDNPIKDVREAKAIGDYLANKRKEPEVLRIKDLRTGMKKVSLKAEVLQIARPTVVVTRYGNCASVANALLSDDTGKIKLCLWNEQIASISVGDTVQIENARISTFRGERQLRVGKNGVLHPFREVIEN